MKKFMIRFICAVIAVCATVLACSHKFGDFPFKRAEYDYHFDESGYLKTDNFIFKKNDDQSISYYGTNSLYGAYLAGRVAHLRQDFDQASEYYKIVLAKDPDNESVNRSTYVIYALLGDIDKAAPYAQKEIDDGKKQTLAPLIIAINDFANGEYAKSRQEVKGLKDNVFKNIVTPLINAWAYAGEKNEAEAVKSVDSVVKDPALTTLKMFHKGLIYDYLGNKKKADECFADIVKNHATDVTFRFLEIITDFYVRSGDKAMARQISHHYNDNSMLAVLLAEIDKKIEAGQTDQKAIIDSPQKGLAEALFNVGTIYRIANGNTESAQVYIAASSFLNPEYEIAKIALANILEERGLLKEANRYYEQVNQNSGSYFIARIKIIENLNSMKDYKRAEQNIKSLLREYPNNTQLLSNLGNIAASMNNHKEAIRIYQRALKTIKPNDVNNWPIFYSAAVSYDHLGDKKRTEENLLEALRLSDRHPNVLNYLGYTWLINDKNINEAVSMIIEAFRQYPYEGHVVDSLGWVFYRLGEYDKAVEFLERASDMNPANAVINDHLGDAYWFAGRKNEAVFQWQHALVLKEDSETLHKPLIRAKIADGFVENKVLKITDPKVKQDLDDLKNIDAEW